MKNIFIRLLCFSTIFFCSCENDNPNPNNQDYTPSTPLTDLDGNSYPTINIGNQIWTAKNLDVSHYKNGDTIPQVQNATDWSNLTTGAWCYYENNNSNGVTYGKLYNWYAVIDPRGLAPEGWHIPSNHEWHILVKHINPNADTTSTAGNSDYVVGGMLKATDTTYWKSPNKDATNETGFTALPAGFRWNFGLCEYKGMAASFWSKTIESGFYAWSRDLYYAGEYIGYSNYHFNNGLSVRCVKN